MNCSNWDSVVNKYMDEFDVAGVAITITDKENIIYSKGFGYQSIEQKSLMSPYSMSKIASITKLTTGIVVLNLVEENKLELDSPITLYVPWLKGIDVYNQITIRHLLSHTSGLPSEYSPDGPRDEDKLEESLKTYLPYLKFIGSPKDKIHYYSNWGIRLVSYIAEVITGERFSDLIYKYILNPLHMDHTTVDLSVASTFPLALPHYHADDGNLKELHYISINNARVAAGGLFSTTNDLSKLALLIMNDGNFEGRQIIPSNIISTMKEEFVNKYMLEKNCYGLTMKIKEVDGLKLYGHDGQAPPYFSSLWISDELGHTISILTNTDSGEEMLNLITREIFNSIKDEKELGFVSLPKKSNKISYYESKTNYEGYYIGDSLGLIKIEFEREKMLLIIKDKSYLVEDSDIDNVHYYHSNGKRVSIGFPHTSHNHIYINGNMYRRITPKSAPIDNLLEKYVGEYKQESNIIRFILEDSKLYLISKGNDYIECSYVEDDLFTSSYGIVEFIQQKDRVGGVKIGVTGTLVYNKV